jgi:sulfur dioxygenase
MQNPLLFHQLFEAESSTYTYILADPGTKEAVIIDSVLETVERDLKLLEDLGLNLKFILDSHIHADHVTGAGTIRLRTGAKSALNQVANVQCADIGLKDGDELFFGQFKIKAIATPGHTDACMTFLCENMAFTGDALLIRGTGRTDFQSGSAEQLYESITQRIFTLPLETFVFPAHDYTGLTHTTVETEKRLNPRVGAGKSKAEFVKIMTDQKLSYPKKIDVAIPANKLCGTIAEARSVLSEISPADTASRLVGTLILDVRPKEEFISELGHIPGAHRAELGPELDSFLSGYNREEEIVFVCGSGKRSSQAVKEAKQKGFRNSHSMKGGMLLWKQEKRPVVRS